MVFYAPQGQPLGPGRPQFQPPKKTSGFKIFLIVIGALAVGFIGLVILVGVLGAIFFGGDDEPAVAEVLSTASPSAKAVEPAATADKKTPAKQAAETTYAIGQPVTSKKFEYVITAFQCGIPSVGEYEITKEIAKGQFCQLSISAKNIATKAESLNFSNFKLMSGEIEYSTESWVNITAASGTDSAGFLDKVNPGLQTTGNIYFDVPLKVTPDRVQIDDSILGKATTIDLSS